ncbi:MAG: diaminohydroxyphosphoribosylaminopyrimidine deaminase [Desulforhopalus sp.]|jgi:diaminohydroxyphosphoribosylaminopyrimidine deaminase/5-amino-6-(5-phosphoribosylamino)uracil reductase
MTDEFYMMLAVREAQKGVGRTSPNPAVGAVIVKDSEVVAKGYHKKAGTPHAEIHAINNATCSLKDSTIYVTLEPCSHTGKTPPCCEAIAGVGIGRVVIGMTDPNPLVNGRGIAYLQSKGIEVVTGVLEEECVALNLPFIKYIQQSIPYMVMKAGVSLDGRINYQSGVSGRITGDKSARMVHELRDRFDAIMVGSRTIIADDPSLTTRLDGDKYRDPVRVILDTHLSTSLSSKVYTQESEAATIVICSNGVDENKKRSFEDIGIRVFSTDQSSEGLDLEKVLSVIAEQGICSVLVEGGATLHGSLLKEQYYDFAYLFHAPVFAGDSGQSLVSGVDVASSGAAPRIATPKYQKLGDDMLVSGKICYQG